MPVGAGIESPDTVLELRDGRVFAPVFAFDHATSFEALNPETLDLEPLGTGIAYRINPALLELADGRVLILGNNYGPDPLLPGAFSPTTPMTAEIFDLSTRSSEVVGQMLIPRYSPSVVELLDGRILIAGGGVPSNTDVPIAEVEIFDPATHEFRTVGSLAQPRSGPAVSLLTDGRVLFVGGSTDRTAQQTAEIFDPASGRSLPIDGPTSAGFVQGDRLADGRVMIVHGWCDEVHHRVPGDGLPDTQAPSLVELFDPRVMRFVDAPPLPHCVGNVVGLPDGRAFVTGFYYQPNLITYSGVYDPNDGSFDLGPGPHGYLPSATGLADGRVLIYPGGDGWADGNVGGLAPAWADIFQRTP